MVVWFGEASRTERAKRFGRFVGVGKRLDALKCHVNVVRARGGRALRLGSRQIQHCMSTLPAAKGVGFSTGVVFAGSGGVGFLLSVLLCAVCAGSGGGGRFMTYDVYSAGFCFALGVAFLPPIFEDRGSGSNFFKSRTCISRQPLSLP